MIMSIKKILIPILFLTPLRAVFLFIMPFVNYMLSKYVIVSCKTRSFNLLLFLLIISSIIGYASGINNLLNISVCLFLTIPVLYVFLSSVTGIYNEGCIISFYKYSRLILIAVHIVGILYMAYIPASYRDDALSYSYGDHFNKMNGLAIIDALFVFYYFTKYSNRTKGDIRVLINLIIWFAFFILCFFGLGLSCLIITFGIFFLLKFKISRTIPILFVSILTIYTLPKFFPNNARYLDKNYNAVIEFNVENNNADLRKLMMVYNYIKFVNENPLHAIVGVGPGGFNSRTAFFLNCESKNIVVKTFGSTMPYFHKKYIYPLHNEDVVSFEMGSDGTRNRPFSSLIAFCAEFGLIFTIVFLVFWIRRIFSYYRIMKSDSRYLFLFLANIYFLLVFSVDQWFTTSEFVYFIFFTKIYETYIKSSEKNTLCKLPL